MSRVGGTGGKHVEKDARVYRRREANRWSQRQVLTVDIVYGDGDAIGRVHNSLRVLLSGGGVVEEYGALLVERNFAKSFPRLLILPQQL